MAFGLFFRRLASAAWGIQTLQERLPASGFRVDFPEAIGELDELFTGDVSVVFVAGQIPLAL